MEVPEEFKNIFTLKPLIQHSIVALFFVAMFSSMTVGWIETPLWLMWVGMSAVIGFGVSLTATLISNILYEAITE